MAYKNEDIDLIESFLEGKLTQAELEVFEKRKAEDPEFSQNVRDLSINIESIKGSARESLLKDLKDLENSLPEVVVDEKNTGLNSYITLGTTKIRKLYWRTTQYVALAASLAGILFGLARPYYQYTQIIPQHRDHKTPLAALNLDSYRGEATEAISFDAAAEAFSRNNYSRTIRALENIESKSEVEWMMLGNSYFHKKRFKKASQCFSPDNYSEQSGLMDHAKFALSLSSIAIGKFEAAREQLEDLAKGEGAYASDAAKILETRKLNK